MGTTTNNGWTYPESTDLVKDGATAIETLATDIDTTLGVYAPSTSGLVLINTTSFSGVASQSINDVFTTTYDNYEIVVKGTDSTTTAVKIRVRVGGSDLSTNTYKRSQYGFTYAGATDSDNSASDNGITVGRINSSTFSFKTTIISPFLLENTRVFGISQDTNRGQTHWGYVDNTISYTGFTLIFGSSATGTVSVYGYNK
jgi:hypothetical protein